jgi:hypothetical protein
VLFVRFAAVLFVFFFATRPSEERAMIAAVSGAVNAGAPAEGAARFRQSLCENAVT